MAREAQAKGVDLEVGVVEEVEKDKGEEDFWEETLVVEEMVEEYLGVAGEYSEHQLGLLVGMKEEELGGGEGGGDGGGGDGGGGKGGGDGVAVMGVVGKVQDRSSLVIVEQYYL